MTLETGTLYFSKNNTRFELPEKVSIFGFSVSFFGVCLGIAAIMAIIIILREAKKKKQETEFYMALFPLAVVAALFGARLYYALFQWYPFAEKPLLLFNFRSGGFAYFGALLGAWVTVKLYCRRKNRSFEETADVLCLGAAAAAVPVWAGCMFTKEPVGRFYEGALSVRIGVSCLPAEPDCREIRELLEHATVISGERYISMHPVALYGMAAALAIFAVLYGAKRFLKREGQVFWLYLFLNAIGILAVESFRASCCTVWGTTVPINCVMAGVLILTILLSVIRKLPKKGVR